MYHILSEEDMRGFQARIIMASTSTKRLEVVYDFDRQSTYFLVTNRVLSIESLPYVNVNAAIAAYNELR